MNIYAAISMAMGKIGAIGKTRRNAQQGFNFRGIDDVLNAIHPVLVECGIVIVPEILEINREDRTAKSGSPLVFTVIKARFRFFAADGSSVEAVTAGEGMDSADKSASKAMSAAMKYAVLFTFSIPTEDLEDADRGGGTLNDAPQQPPRQQPAGATDPGLKDALLGKISRAKSADELEALKPELTAAKSKLSASVVNGIAEAFKTRAAEIAKEGAP